MGRNKLTEEQKQYILDNYESAETVDVIRLGLNALGRKINNLATVRVYARQLGLSRDLKMAAKQRSATLLHLYEVDRLRISYGLEPKTKMIKAKPLTKDASYFRRRARHYKYIVTRGMRWVVGYNANTIRKEKLEKFGIELGFSIINEETFNGLASNS